MIANNPYYRDTTLTTFVDTYYYQTTYASVPNLVDSTGKLIFPDQITNIGVSFANWNFLEITGHPVRWLEAVAKYAIVLGEEFFTVSIYDAWGKPGSKFLLSFTIDKNLRNYPNFPERSPTFIPITSSLAKNHEGSPSVIDVPEIMDISITVYDLLGRKVNTVVDNQFTPGTHKITFDGSSIATGTYFYILETDQGDRIIRKMLLSK